MDPELTNFTALHGTPVRLRDATWLYPDGAQARSYLLEEPDLDQRRRLQAQRKYRRLLLQRLEQDEALLSAALTGRAEAYQFPRDWLAAHLGPPPPIERAAELLNRLTVLAAKQREEIARLDGLIGVETMGSA
jgi:hypothetical protein